MTIDREVNTLPAPPEPDRKRVEEETIMAIVDYLRHLASGYALMRSVKANAISSALHQIASGLEKNWRSVVLPRRPVR